jgi:hypothetical protein
VLLDVAVGAGAVEVCKYLLEFHETKPTRETLKMAVASDSLELLRLIWARVPSEQHVRGDLLEVAADFHRNEPLMWLFRASTVFEQELFFVFALEARVADGLLEVQRDGIRPWLRGTRETAAKFREAGGIELGEPPEEFSSDGGWWEDAQGVIRAIGVRSIEPWTGTMTNALMEDRGQVVGVVLPGGVTAMSGDAFNNCQKLRWLVIQPGCVKIGDGTTTMIEYGYAAHAGYHGHVYDLVCEGAVAGCSSLVNVTIPSSVTMIGGHAFRECLNLKRLTIPSSVTSIGPEAFYNSGLMRLTIAPIVMSIGRWLLHVDTSFVGRDERLGECFQGMFGLVGGGHSVERNWHREWRFPRVLGVVGADAPVKRDQHRGLGVRQLLPIAAADDSFDREEHRAPGVQQLFWIDPTGDLFGRDAHR